MKQLPEDTYFINRDKALIIVQKHNAAAESNLNKTAVPICYHDGTPFANPPSNLINVPIKNLISYFSQHPQRIPTRIDTDFPGITEENKKNLEKDFFRIMRELQQLHQKQKRASLWQDSYFLDNKLALETARLKNRVRLNHPNIDGLQICYYSGDQLSEEYDNLIQLPTENMLDFFTETRLRLPQKLVLPPDTSIEIQLDIYKTFNEIIQEAVRRRTEISKEYSQISQQLKPEFDSNSPLRIFLPTSRMTEVMQYCSKNLAKVFNRLGHNAFLSMEHNDMESLSAAWMLKEYCNFIPHLIININHTNNNFIHPDVFNVTWWQDPMQELVSGKTLPWRKRDIIMSVYPFIDKHLEQSGATNIRRQHFCIDNDCFKIYPDISRKQKIVFIGSSYRRHIEILPTHKKNIIFKYQKQLVNGKLVLLKELKNMIEDLPLAMHTRNYIVRDTTVRWLCEQSDIPVEIYGRGWEYDPIIQAHFKGELPHGKDVAEVYNSASHALICIPEFINSQRLFEIAACGCIPVVYDSRNEAEEPHWNEECLFFKTREQLHQCIHQKPLKNPVGIAEQFTYENMAKSIIQIINATLGTHY